MSSNQRGSLAALYRSRQQVNTTAWELRAVPAVIVILASMLFAAPTAMSASLITVDQQSHRGIYALSLHDVASSSEIADVGGEMYYEWAKTCAGWRVNQWVSMEILHGEGDVQTLTLLFSAFESSDGSVFDFTMQQASDGTIVERMSGRATIDEAGAGAVQYTEPPGAQLDLPLHTLFPSRYAALMLEQAHAGRTTFAATVFDGSSAATAYSVVTFFGGQEQALSLHSGELEPLWPAHMGYFPENEVASEPDFEIGVRMFENGIAQAFLIYYGSFAVNSTLTDYEAIPAPQCTD